MSRIIDSTLRLIDQFSPTLRAVNNASASSKSILAGVSSSTRELGGDLTKTASKLAEFSKINNRIGKEVKATGAGIASFGKSIPVAALIGAATAGYYLSASLDKAMGKIKMLGGLTSDQTAKMRKDFINLSNDTGVSVSTIAEAAQKAVAGGMTAGGALVFMDECIKQSKISGMELNDVVAAGISYTKSYNLSAREMAKINDMQIVTARLAKVEMSTMIPALASIAKSANDAGVSVDQMDAAFVLMARHGVDTQRAAGSLGGLFDSFAKASPKAIKAAQEFGIELSNAHIAAVGFPAFLQEIQDKTGGDEAAIGKIIKDVEAFKLALKMTSDGGGAEFKQILLEISKSSGATSQALKDMNTPSATVGKALNELKNSGMELGAAVAPVVIEIAGGIRSLVGWFNSLDDSTKGIILSILKYIVVMGALSLTAGKVLGMFGGWFTTFGKITSAFGNAKGVIVGLRTEFTALKGVFDFLSGAGRLLAKAITGSFGLISKGVIFAFRTVIGIVTAGAKIIAGAFGLIGKAALFLLHNPIILAIALVIAAAILLYTHWDQVKAFMIAAWQTISAAFQAGVTWCGNTISSLVDSFTALINYISGTFSAAWSAAWSGIVSVFSSIFNEISSVCDSVMAAIKSAINAVIGGLNNISVDIPSWVPNFGGQHFGLEIAYLAKGTENWPGGPAVINDAGGEVVDLPKGTRVIPHDKSMQEEYKRGQASQNKLTGITIAKLADQIIVREDADIDKIAQALYRKLESTAINRAVGAV